MQIKSFNGLSASASVTLIGRDAELTQIEQLFADSACRLLTLVGPGGIGKTRLALEAAQRLDFPNGVHIILFQPLTSAAADQMIATIADALGFQLYAGADPKQQLLNYLREKSLLLVLDNLEHLLDGVTLLAEILATAPQIRLLATSRERLNLREEWVMEVGGLDYPMSVTATAIAGYSAIELFLNCAHRINVNFKLSDGQKAAIIRICRLVEGMPLGIELSAAWTRALSCDQIAEEIERSLDILQTSTRNVEPRHRSIRATLDQSWNLLSQSEQEVFKKLSIFRGDFSHETAEQIAGATLPILATLVDKSLLRLNEHGYYELQELLRQYAEEKLSELPLEQEQVSDQHCIYFADFMAQWRDDENQIFQRETRMQIMQHIDNIRAAFQWAISKRKFIEMNKFVAVFGNFCNAQSWFQEGISTLKLVAERVRETLDETDEQQMRTLGLSLSWQALFSSYFRKLDEAQELAQEGLAMLLRFGNGHEIWRAYNTLATVSDDWTKKKRQYAQEALKYAQANNIFIGVGSALAGLSWISFGLGEYEESRLLALEALAICRQHNLKFIEVHALKGLSDAACVRQNYAEAKQWAQEALAAAESVSARQEIVMMRVILGGIAYAQRAYAEAKLYCYESFLLAQELGDLQWQLWAGVSLGKAVARLGNTLEARQYLRETLRIAYDTQQVDAIRSSVEGMATLKAMEGDAERALELLASLFRDLKNVYGYKTEDELLRSELELLLAPEVYAAAWERGKNLELNTLVAELLSELNQSVETSEAVMLLTITSPADLLTERELKVLHLIAAGFSNREIADQLVLAVSTVKWYINEIFSKLHVTTRTQAVEYARTLGLLP